MNDPVVSWPLPSKLMSSFRILANAHGDAADDLAP